MDGRLWGTWQLESAIERDASTGRLLPPPYGTEHLGLLAFTERGRMVSVVCDGRDVIAEGGRRAYTSYCGSYRVEGDSLTTIVDAAADETRIGTRQVRQFELRGDVLILKPPPRDTGSQRELTWRKIA
jgi:hypothetical protein